MTNCGGSCATRSAALSGASSLGDMGEPRAQRAAARDEGSGLILRRVGRVEEEAAGRVEDEIVQRLRERFEKVKMVCPLPWAWNGTEWKWVVAPPHWQPTLLHAKHACEDIVR